MRVLGGVLVAAVITQHERASPNQGAGLAETSDRVARPGLLRTLAGALSSPVEGMRVAVRAGRTTGARMRARTPVPRATAPQLVLDALSAQDVATKLGFTYEKATEIVRSIDQNSDGKVDPRELKMAVKNVQSQPGYVDPFPDSDGPEKDLILIFGSEQLQKERLAKAELLAPERDVEAADLQAAAALQDALSEKYKLVQGLKARQEKAEAVLAQAGAPESPKTLNDYAERWLLPESEREKRAKLRSAAETEKIIASVEEVIEYMDKLNPPTELKKNRLQLMSPPELLAKSSEPDAAKSAAAAAKAAADKATSASAPAAEAAARAADSARLAAEQIAKASSTSDQATATAARASAKKAVDQAKEAAKDAVEFAADEAVAVVEATAAEIALGVGR